MKKGFDRLRGVATASAIGLGLLGGGSARAATVSTPFSVTVTGTNFTAIWTAISNQSPCDVLHCDSVSTTGGFTHLISASNSAFGIDDASVTTTGDSGSDFWDSGMNLAVGNVLFVNPDNTVDLTGTTVTTDVVADIIPGVDAQIQYYFSPDRAVVRGLYTLMNTTGSPISTSALVMGDYGADSSTTVQATSSGDTVFDTNDQWVVSNDNTTLGGEGSDPTATATTYGTGAAVMPVLVMKPGTPTPPSNTPDKFGFRYDVTIPANGTVRIMVFNEQTLLNATAVANAADYESLAAADAAGLLAGLDAQTQSEIVNYGPGSSGGGSSDSENWWEKTFSLDVPGLLALGGSLLWFRSRGRKRQS